MPPQSPRGSWQCCKCDGLNHYSENEYYDEPVCTHDIRVCECGRKRGEGRECGCECGCRCRQGFVRKCGHERKRCKKQECYVDDIPYEIPNLSGDPDSESPERYQQQRRRSASQQQWRDDSRQRSPSHPSSSPSHRISQTPTRRTHPTPTKSPSFPLNSPLPSQRRPPPASRSSRVPVSSLLSDSQPNYQRSISRPPSSEYYPHQTLGSTLSGYGGEGSSHYRTTQEESNLPEYGRSLMAGYENTRQVQQHKSPYSTLPSPAPVVEAPRSFDRPAQPLYKHSCTECPKSFKYPSELDKHFRQKHTKPAKTGAFNCVPCQSTYSSKSYLNEHNRIYHSEGPVKRFKCNARTPRLDGRSECTASYDRFKNLSRPWRVYHGEYYHPVHNPIEYTVEES